MQLQERGECLSSTHQPFIKWYPTDWRADPRLRMCSLSARGLWIELIGYMHEGDPYGHLTINGERPDLADIASLVGRPIGEVSKAMSELERRQVYSIDEAGHIFSRRMVRDKAKAEQDRNNGKGGGNPNLKSGDKGGVNPKDKAQIPEARKKDAAGAADPEVDLFRRGREVLGKDSGGLIAKLLASKNKNIALARAALEQASTKSDPREYIGAVIRGKKNADEPQWLDGIPGVL